MTDKEKALMVWEDWKNRKDIHPSLTDKGVFTKLVSAAIAAERKSSSLIVLDSIKEELSRPTSIDWHFVAATFTIVVPVVFILGIDIILGLAIGYPKYEIILETLALAGTFYVSNKFDERYQAGKQNANA